MGTAAVIAAAGMSSRMGDFKPMLKVGSMSMARRVIANFQRAGAFPIVLVTGFRGAELEKHVAGTGVICVRNEHYASTQMFDSAKIGLSYVAGKCERAFFCPVDVPLFTAETVSRLLATSAPVAKPIYRGAGGHPILISNAALPSLIAKEGDGGLRAALSEVTRVPVDDEGVLLDADTPDDYRRLVDWHNRQLLRPTVEVSLMRENKLFDRDISLLLRVVEYTGTVKEACEQLRISYSKAWGMLSEMEENLGFALIERRPGGEMGGGSRLTEEGRKLLFKYEALVDGIRAFADRRFAEIFGDGRGRRP